MPVDLEKELSIPSPLQEIALSDSHEKKITVFVKRDDLIHPVIQGNKWRKLTYNIEELKQKGKTRIVTMGGPWSNHLAAVATVCNMLGLRSQVYLRGVFEKENYTATMKQCLESGMEIKMCTKNEYDSLKQGDYDDLMDRIGIDDFFIPEGGSNSNGVKGCLEIRNEIQIPFDYIIAAIGSGTTCAGLALACSGKQKVLAVNIFKNADGLKNMIEEKIRLLEKEETRVTEAFNRIEIIDGYSFGGFARVTPELEDFRLSLYKDTGMDTDLVYTSKVFYAVDSLIRTHYFKKGDNIVVLHTGGIQGNRGFQQKMNQNTKI